MAERFSQSEARSAGSDEQPRTDTSVGAGSAADGVSAWITRIGAQTVLLTAALFYFGWARANATFAYFGVDLSLIDLATSDYLLRSVNSVVKPLLIVGALALAVALVRDVIASKVFDESHPGLVKHLSRAAFIVGLMLVGSACAALAAGSTALWRPVALATGLALLSVVVSGRLDFADVSPESSRRAPAPATILAALAVVACLWAISLYAAHVGTSRAVTYARDLAKQTSVVVYSRASLGLTGPGVRPTRLSAGGEYTWRYSGLRLLIRSGKRYFLIPSGWRRGKAAVYIVAEDARTRLELTAS